MKIIKLALLSMERKFFVTNKIANIGLLKKMTELLCQMVLWKLIFIFLIKGIDKNAKVWYCVYSTKLLKAVERSESIV